MPWERPILSLSPRPRDRHRGRAESHQKNYLRMNFISLGHRHSALTPPPPPYGAAFAHDATEILLHGCHDRFTACRSGFRRRGGPPLPLPIAPGEVLSSSLEFPSSDIDDWRDDRLRRDFGRRPLGGVGREAVASGASAPLLPPRPCCCSLASSPAVGSSPRWPMPAAAADMLRAPPIMPGMPIIGIGLIGPVVLPDPLSEDGVLRSAGGIPPGASMAGLNARPLARSEMLAARGRL
jgi:hypothetical protein